MGKGAWLRAFGRSLGLIVALLLSATAYARARNALWSVVHGLCVVDKRVTGFPAPCTAVDRAHGIAVVKDIGRTGYLLVPTRRVSGVEDPQLLRPDAPNYWQAAWEARRFVARRAGRALPRDAVALAINAIAGRSQDQLHIHVDCVRPAVREALRREGPRLGPDWTGIALDGQPYRVRTLADAELAAHDPFRLVAESDPDTRAAMGEQTIALVGGWPGDGAPGFYLLAARASPANRGHAEALLDHGCDASGG